MTRPSDDARRPAALPGVPRRLVLGAVPLALAGLALWAPAGSPLGRGALRAAPAAGPGPAYRALAAGGPWLNGPPLDAGALRGRVVLVNFWTYTCINSLRPLPYLNAWADRYRDRGLVVVGVHSPEFSFETDLGRIRRAVADQGVRFPVLVDNRHAVWRGFGNSAWPGFYFVDGEGRVRGRVLGEEKYAASERLIQGLLAAQGARADDPIVRAPGAGVQAAADWANLRSPETYLGHARASAFAGPGRLRPHQAAAYRRPGRLPLNRWCLDGRWRVEAEAATLNDPSGRLALRFHARDLHLVLAPGQDGRPIPFRVRIDGRPPGRDAGGDVDRQGAGELREARMYQLVRQARSVAERTFEIEFLGPGASAFAFTFG